MRKTVRSLEHILLFLALAGCVASGHLAALAADGEGSAGNEGRHPPWPGPPNPVAEPSFLTLEVKPPLLVLSQTICIYGSLSDMWSDGLGDQEVHIQVSPPEGDGESFTATTNSNGDYVLFFTPGSASVGWTATASWVGNTTYDGATAGPVSFNVLPANTLLTIEPSSQALRVNSGLDVTGRLKSTAALPPPSALLAGQKVSLYVLEPGSDTPSVLSTVTDENGEYGFADILLTRVGTWRLWAKFGGSSDLNPSASSVIRVQAKEGAGYAIVVSGRSDDDAAVLLHNRTADTVYHKLEQRGITGENIFYLRFGIPLDVSIAVDATPAEGAIGYAITDWAKQQMLEQPGPLFIVFIGSGRPWRFFVSGEEEVVTPWQLDAWITALEKSLRGSPAEGQPITFIYGAPYSGSFVHRLSSEENPRVVITSSDSNELPVTGPEEDTADRQGDFLVLELFENLWRGWNLKRSFELAAGAIRTYTRNTSGNGLPAGLAYPDLSGHHPLLDDNGDGIGSFGYLSFRPGDDGFVSSHIFLGYGVPKPEARIIAASPKQVIVAGEGPDLWAEVADPGAVEAVWMVIKPPLFAMGAPIGDPWLHRDVNGIRVPMFDRYGLGTYSSTEYPPFEEKGTYRVLFFVKDSTTGQLGEIWETKVVVFDPEAPEPSEFSILSPEDGATVGEQVLLEWSESQRTHENDEVTYTVQVATDASFANVVFEESDLEGTSLLLGEEEGLLDKATYYWRVRAENFFGKSRFARGAAMRSIDIGSPLAGNTAYNRSSDTYIIFGDGRGTLESEDQLRFIHTSAGGSFEVSARLDFLEDITSPALAGLMIRQSMGANSPYAMIALSAGGEILGASRNVPGSPASTEYYGHDSSPLYLKLACVRLSDLQVEIRPSFSFEGLTWSSQTPMELLMTKDVHVGICVTSGEEGRLVKAVFSEFTVSPLTEDATGTGLLSLGESALYTPPPAETLGTEYSTFQTNQGAGLPGYNVLTVLVYNENDPSQSPPGTSITISPIVGTINNWMYSGYLPVGTYTIDVTAPSFSPEHRETELTVESPATEVFTLTPNPGSVSGKVVDANDLSDLRGASVQLEVTSGIYLGTQYDAVTGSDGRFSLTALPAAIAYQITVSKTFYNAYQAPFALGAGEAKDLGTISLGFTDNDSDGLPDEFEQTIVDFDPGDEIEDIYDVHGEEDFDGDGQTNGDEYVAGTDATSAGSFLRIITIASNSSDAITIVWTSISGKLYTVYYGETIGGWSLLDSDIPASGTGENSWTDDDASGTIPPPADASIRFYRVEAY